MQNFCLILGSILILFGTLFILVGIIGIVRLNSFYSRILVCSNIDVAGFIAIALGVSLRAYSLVFFIKILLIIVISLIINPITTHEIARSAYASGHSFGPQNCKRKE